MMVHLTTAARVARLTYALLSSALALFAIFFGNKRRPAYA